MSSLEALGLFGRTFIIGVAVAAPVGAMGVLCIQRTLSRGWGIGFATGAGIASADAFYAALAAFGVSEISQTLAAAQPPLRVIGGAILVLLGARAAFARPYEDAEPREDGIDVGSAYLSAVGLTLTNPMTIMAFAAVFTTAGLTVHGGWGASALATLGVAAGSLAWWIVLTAVVARTRHAFTPQTLRAVNVGSGVLVIAFGLMALVGALL